MGRTVGPGSPPAANEAGPQHTERLIISHMVLENFKSYAGVQNVGPFHKCFSSVVGPNGSGKSNVIDAMLFVFGKRAKQLRLNKVSELIHNSTDHQNLDFARVSVHFQKIIDLEGEEYEVVPDTQFVVTRTAYRNNSSKYFVDDVPSTFTEVTKLLKAEGIDLDNNRFLILQGEVEQIAMMKPKGQAPGDEGLLEYLEDIIGTNKYVEAIEKSAAMLEELNEKRGGLVQRVKMAEKDRDSLEEEKREAEKFMLKEAELAKWSRVSCAISLRDAAHHKEELEKRVEQLQKNMEAELGKSKSAREELDKLKEEVDEYGKEYELARVEMEKAQADFHEYERKDVLYKEELKNCKAKLKKLDDKIAKDTAKLQETVQATKDAEESLPGLEKTLEKSIKQLGKEEEALESVQEKIRGQVASLQTKYEALRRQLEPFEEQLTALESKAEVTKTQHSLLTEKHATAKAQYEVAENGIKEKGVAAEEKKAAVQQMKAEEARARKELATAQAEEQAAGAEVNQKSATLEQLRRQLAELKDSVSSERSQSAVMSALRQAKQSGQIPGIKGRLGDLGGIRAEYDVAISTACGPLDYIVVDTANTAQQCVELLREKQLGVATFLVLDKQQALVREMNQPVQTPEGVERLFDLVDTSDEFRPAFFYGLRNTVVAKDVEQGTRIAYGADTRFRRVVTLGGVLFESSGTMSGGGGKPRGGRMGTAPLQLPMGAVAAGRGGAGGQAAVQRLEAEAAETQEEVQAAYQRQQDARKRWSNAQEQVDRLRAEIPKAELEAEGLREQVKELQKRVAQLKAGAVPSEAELKQLKALEKQLKAEEAEAEKCRQSFAPLKRQVDDLQQQIDETGKAELEAQRGEVAGLQKAISDTKASINQCRVQISSSDKVVARLEKGVREAREEREKETRTMEQKKRELKAVEKEAFSVHEIYMAANERSGEKREVHEGAKKKFAKLKQQVEKMRAGEVDTQLKLDDTKKQLKAYSDSEKALEAKLKALEAKLEKALEQLESDGLDEERQLEALGPEPDMESLRKEDAQRKEAELVTQLKALKPNLAALEEYRKKQSMYDDRVAELERVSKEREESRRAYEELREQRLHEFVTGFNVISTRLKEMYQMITLGGDAELELVDSLDPFSEGIVFSVRPPKKSWKNICNLSGGEKTLSSLALVFALHHYKPTPLYVMDEIDAALDFKNVSIVAHYIKDRTKNAQFVIISLRNNMFELADHLVGIYKTHNCTKSLTIDPNAFTVGSAAGASGKAHAPGEDHVMSTQPAVSQVI